MDWNSFFLGAPGCLGESPSERESHAAPFRSRFRSIELSPPHGVYGDLFKDGVVDAAKVTRSALQNAASIAALFLTTEAIVADKPEKEKAPAMPDGGDMDF